MTPPKLPGVTLLGGQAVVNPAWLVLPSSHSEWPESVRSSAIASGADVYWGMVAGLSFGAGTGMAVERGVDQPGAVQQVGRVRLHLGGEERVAQAVGDRGQPHHAFARNGECGGAGRRRARPRRTSRRG